MRQIASLGQPIPSAILTHRQHRLIKTQHRQQPLLVRRHIRIAHSHYLHLPLLQRLLLHRASPRCYYLTMPISSILSTLRDWRGDASSQLPILRLLLQRHDLKAASPRAFVFEVTLCFTRGVQIRLFWRLLWKCWVYLTGLGVGPYLITSVIATNTPTACPNLFLHLLLPVLLLLGPRRRRQIPPRLLFILKSDSWPLLALQFLFQEFLLEQRIVFVELGFVLPQLLPRILLRPQLLYLLCNKRGIIMLLVDFQLAVLVMEAHFFHSQDVELALLLENGIERQQNVWIIWYRRLLCILNYVVIATSHRHLVSPGLLQITVTLVLLPVKRPQKSRLGDWLLVIHNQILVEVLRVKVYIFSVQLVSILGQKSRVISLHGLPLRLLYPSLLACLHLIFQGTRDTIQRQFFHWIRVFFEDFALGHLLFPQYLLCLIWVRDICIIILLHPQPLPLLLRHLIHPLHLPAPILAPQLIHPIAAVLQFQCPRTLCWFPGGGCGAHGAGWIGQLVEEGKVGGGAEGLL